MACPRCKRIHHVDAESVRNCLRANPMKRDVVHVSIPIKINRPKRKKHPVPVSVWRGDAKP